MSEQIDALLGLSRFLRGELRRSTVDLSALARDIARELVQQDAGRPVTFIIADALSAYADPRLMRAVMENLLGNAWKFTAQTTSAVIEFGAQPSADGATSYFVRDNGVGFDMAYAGKLFGTFQRLHAASEFPGHGIGLAIVGRVIRRHGGRVWADSQVNAGATFFFTLEGKAAQHCSRYKATGAHSGAARETPVRRSAPG
jgi:light-regulated signal transduction histidine kinase (bacteriophytochrome)